MIMRMMMARVIRARSIESAALLAKWFISGSSSALKAVDFPLSSRAFMSWRTPMTSSERVFMGKVSMLLERYPEASSNLRPKEYDLSSGMS